MLAGTFQVGEQHRLFQRAVIIERKEVIRGMQVLRVDGLTHCAILAQAGCKFVDVHKGSPLSCMVKVL